MAGEGRGGLGGVGGEGTRDTHTHNKAGALPLGVGLKRPSDQCPGTSPHFVLPHTPSTCSSSTIARFQFPSTLFLVSPSSSRIRRCGPTQCLAHPLFLFHLFLPESEGAAPLRVGPTLVVDAAVPVGPPSVVLPQLVAINRTMMQHLKIEVDPRKAYMSEMRPLGMMWSPRLGP